MILKTCITFPKQVILFILYNYRCQGISVKYRSGPATVIPDPAVRDECFAKIMVTVLLKRYGKAGRTGKARKPAYMIFSKFDPVVRVGSIPVHFLSISITSFKDKLPIKGICIAFIPIWESYPINNISSIIRFFRSNSRTAKFTPLLRIGRIQ